MSQLTAILGGQWLAFFEGQQSGHGLLSFNTFAESGGYISLYQHENLVEKIPTLLLQGRVTVMEVSAQSFVATAKKTSAQAPGEISVRGNREVDSSEWIGTWKSTAGYSGNFKMVKLEARPFGGAEIEQVADWNEFSNWAFCQSPDESVFRGLGDNRYALQSTAHRAGIFDLHYYLVEVLPRVRAELLKRHGLRINISSPDGLAEILALIRHHGFPSPVMDWSKSPWVALYFAMVSAQAQAISGGDASFCRIYCMRHNGISVVADVQSALLAPNLGGPLAEIPTPMTSRVTAQEGVFLLTPCVDVLSTFSHRQKATSTTPSIQAIDISLNVAEEFLDRLDRMMINEATMLSSIDSTLNHLKKRLLR